jgi:hypothetical protein
VASSAMVRRSTPARELRLPFLPSTITTAASITAAVSTSPSFAVMPKRLWLSGPDGTSYLRRGKNDAANAAAICEAVTRPLMRFVPLTGEEQQAPSCCTASATCWSTSGPS